MRSSYPSVRGAAHATITSEKAAGAFCNRPRDRGSEFLVANHQAVVELPSALLENVPTVGGRIRRKLTGVYTRN
jgi:hypothetical protein